MDGNLKDMDSNVWYIVGRPFEHFAKLDQVTTFDAFLYSILQSDVPKHVVGVLGQGLSVLEIQCLHRLSHHFPQVGIVGKNYPVGILLENRKKCFYLENQHAVNSSQYECDINFTEWMTPKSEYRLPIHVLIESGRYFLDEILDQELQDKDYGIRITQLQCGEVNIPFPVQTKCELNVTDIRIKKAQLFLKSRIRFYQRKPSIITSC